MMNMALQDDFIEAFNNCIDRLNAGESLEDILQDYPDLATQLRPMLEAGFLVKRARYPVSDVEHARQNTEPQIQQAINTTFGGGFFGISTSFLLILLVGSGLLVTGLLAVMTQNNMPVTSIVTDATPMQPTLPSTADSSVNNTIASTVQPTITQAEIVATTSPLAVSTGTTNEANGQTVSETVSVIEVETTPSSTEDVEASSVEDIEADTITIIEGPVDAIDGNQISIYDFDITLDADDPRLSIIQIGDIMRVEGLDDGTVVVVLTFEFTSVEVFVLDDIVWRDSGDCSNPPPAWAAAEGWRVRCEGAAPATSNTGGDGLPPGCKLTGFGTGNVRVKCSGAGASRRSD